MLSLSWQRDLQNVTYVKTIFLSHFNNAGFHLLVEQILNETMPYGTTIWKSGPTSEPIYTLFTERLPTV